MKKPRPCKKLYKIGEIGDIKTLKTVIWVEQSSNQTCMTKCTPSKKVTHLISIDLLSKILF